MFEIGDRVTMSLAGTRWCTIRNGDFSGQGSNPFGVEGVVVKARDGGEDLPFLVRWANGQTNSYSGRDLEPFNCIQENE